MMDKMPDEIWLICPWDAEVQCGYLADEDRDIFTDAEKAVKYVRKDLAQAAIPDGDVIVPIEPTEEMCIAGGEYTNDKVAVLIYKAMLDAHRKTCKENTIQDDDIWRPIETVDRFQKVDLLSDRRLKVGCTRHEGNWYDINNNLIHIKPTHWKPTRAALETCKENAENLTRSENM